uniref:NADH dehydrogenase subunit 2 n=1 Tax=Cyanophora paradoxa TaxID=2762 RepID=A0A097PBS6_CYAPA|nr:NADH dehydrogenase subunit 2 [Cyanophora paradoxa]
MYLLFNYTNFLYFIAEFYFCTSIIILLIFGVFWYNLSNHINNIYKPILIKNSIWLLVLSMSFYILLLFEHINLQNIFLFDKALELNSYYTFAKIFLFLIAIFVIAASLNYVKNDKINQYEYTVLIACVTLGSVLLINSFNMLSAYLALELQTLAMYVLIAIKRNSEKSLEASIKYLILSAFSSGILLFGLCLIYGITGTLHFDKINNFLSIYFFEFKYNNFFFYNNYELSALLFSNILIIIGFLFKINAAPFHIWAPDVYEGSPTSVTAYLSTASKIGSLFFFIKLIILPFFPIFFNLTVNNNLLLICTILSLILGSFGALYQKKLKRLAAYSTIANIGYILIGLYLIFCSIDSLEGATFYIVVYIITSITFFLILLSLRKNTGANLFKYLADIKALNVMNPFLSLTLALILLSMAGIPPLAGFFAKLYIFLSAITQEKYWLSIIGILTSTVSCFYYLRLIKNMYFEKIDKYSILVKMDREKSLILGLNILLITFFFLNPNIILNLINYCL